MQFATGATLGPYTIAGPLGAGGMGEVYRARDPRLDRDVAIKVLPASLAADPDSRARFEREARAVAALSHPNILAIHDVGADAGVTYVVMELLEGGTLRERLAGGALPIKKAVSIAGEVALGLAAAHDAGLVHRDIKPENLFVTSAGLVKILDFGLARPMHMPDAEDANSPTFFRKTDPGMVMGTVGYMSPEQVKGLPADHRSDIFSLGCVLFEMVSGRKPFERPTAAETMTAVLREDPVEIARPDAAIPASLDQLVRHCLEKEPGERFQSARDLAFALKAQAGVSTSSGPAAVLSVPSRRPAWRLGLTAALVGAGIAGGHYLWTNAAEAGPQPLTFQQISDVRGISTEPTLSPDGKTVVYTHVAMDDNNLYLLRVGSRTPVLLTPNAPAGNSTPVFSPDGEHIAFRSERDGGGIFIMAATGESVSRLTDVGYNPSWSPDGKEIVVSHGRFISPTDRGSMADGLTVLNVASGDRRQVLKDADGMQPAWSPHGQRIAYWGLRQGSGQRDLWTIAADGSELDTGPTEVTNDTAVDWSPAWSPDGRFLYFSSRRGGTMNLWRVAIDEATGRTRGQPEPITTPSAWSGFYSFSRDGSRLAFASVNWRSTLFKLPFDSVRETVTGSPVPMLKGSHAIRDHAISPDQQWVALMETGERESIIVARTDGSEYRRITDDDFRNRSPQWSPDGKRLLFYSDRSGSYEVWTVRPDGSGLERLTRSLLPLNFPTWAPDGRRIPASAVSKPWWQIIDVTQPPAQPPAESMPQIAADTAFWPASWSADGRRLAGLAMHSDSTTGGTAVYDIAARQFTVIPMPTFNWSTPVWLPDNDRLLVRNDAGILLADVRTRATKLLLPVGGYSIGPQRGADRRRALDHLHRDGDGGGNLAGDVQRKAMTRRSLVLAVALAMTLTVK